jgi:hypothetical protein
MLALSNCANAAVVKMTGRTIQRGDSMADIASCGELAIIHIARKVAASGINVGRPGSNRETSGHQKSGQSLLKWRLRSIQDEMMVRWGLVQLF